MGEDKRLVKFKGVLEKTLIHGPQDAARNITYLELVRIVNAKPQSANYSSGLLNAYLETYGTFPTGINDQNDKYTFKEKITVVRLSTRVFELLVEKNIRDVEGFILTIEEIVNRKISSASWLGLKLDWRYVQALSFYDFEKLSASARGVRHVEASEFDSIKRAVIAYRNSESKKTKEKKDKETILDELKKEHSRQKSTIALDSFNPIADIQLLEKTRQEFEIHVKACKEIEAQIKPGADFKTQIELLTKRFEAFLKYLDEQRTKPLILFQLLLFARNRIITTVISDPTLGPNNNRRVDRFSQDYFSHEIYLQILFAIQHRALANRNIISTVANAGEQDKAFFLAPFRSYSTYSSTFTNRILYSHNGRQGRRMGIGDFIENSKKYLYAYHYGRMRGISLATDKYAVPILEELQEGIKNKQVKERLKQKRYKIPETKYTRAIRAGSYKIGDKILLDTKEKEFGIMYLGGGDIYITNEDFYPILFKIPDSKFTDVLDNQTMGYVHLKTRGFFKDLLSYFMLAFDLASMLLAFQSRGLWGLFKAILEDKIEDKLIQEIVDEAKALGLKDADTYALLLQLGRTGRNIQRGISDTSRANSFKNFEDSRGLPNELPPVAKAATQGDSIPNDSKTTPKGMDAKSNTQTLPADKTNKVGDDATGSKGTNKDFLRQDTPKDPANAVNIEKTLDKIEVRDQVKEMNSGLPLRIKDIEKYVEGLKRKPRIPVEWKDAIENSEPLRKLLGDAEKVELVRMNEKAMGEHPAYFQKSAMGSEYELQVTLDGVTYKLDGVFVKKQGDKYVSYLGEAKFTYKGDLESFHAPGKKNPTTSYHFGKLDDKVLPQFAKYSDLAKAYGFEGVAVVTNTDFLWQTFEQSSRHMNNVEIFMMDYSYSKKRGTYRKK